MRAAIFAWGHIFVFPEHLREVGKVRVPELQGHHAHRDAGVLQHILGSLDLGQGNILLDVLPGLAFEELGEILRTHEYMFGHILDRDGIGQVFGDKGFGLFDVAARRQQLFELLGLPQHIDCGGAQRLRVREAAHILIVGILAAEGAVHIRAIFVEVVEEDMCQAIVCVFTFKERGGRRPWRMQPGSLLRSTTKPR